MWCGHPSHWPVIRNPSPHRLRAARLHEDSKEIEDRQVVSTEGSWEAGVGDYEPGIIMLAHPKVGWPTTQELAPDR